MRSGINLDFELCSLLVFLFAQEDELWIVEVEIAHGRVVNELIAGWLFGVDPDRISSAMSNHPRDRAGVAVHRERGRNARPARKSGGVNAVLVNGKAAMRVIPHGLCGLQLRRGRRVNYDGGV